MKRFILVLPMGFRDPVPFRFLVRAAADPESRR